MSRDAPITSPFLRFVKLGGLAGRVGFSLLGTRASEIARRGGVDSSRRAEAMVRNATRIVETLGELKGAAMKVGQMISLHEGLLPAEVAEVLRSLQRQAPRVPFEVMEYELRGQLKKDYDRLFEHLEPEAFAAASIGQVHRGRLRDGREVAVKIQYPEIDNIIRADLGNLRRVIQALFGLVSNVDFEPVWSEVRDRLLEEIDYTHEADNIRRMAALHADVPEIVIPAVIDEATTSRVLTMEFREAISPDDACSGRHEQALTDRWGTVLFEFCFRGLLQDRLLHADPNLANFGFFEDGRVVVYDFGCLKRIPEELARGFAELLLAALEGRKELIPRVLREMGIRKEDGSALPRKLTDAYYDLFCGVLRESPPYRYGDDEEIYDDLVDLGLANLGEAVDIRFPKDIVFVNRTLGGHFGNLSRLKAAGPWRAIIDRLTQPYL